MFVNSDRKSDMNVEPPPGAPDLELDRAARADRAGAARPSRLRRAKDAVVGFQRAGGRVIALEPHPRSFSLLCDNVVAHGLRNVVTVHAAAPSRERRRVSLFAARRAASTRGPIEPIGTRADGVESQEVEATPIG